MAATEPTIRNCRFRYACPRDWDQLQETGEDGTRYCDACDSVVYLCDTDAQLRRHILDDHCVAIPMRLRAPDTPYDDGEPFRQTFFLGMPSKGLRPDPHHLVRFVVAQKEAYPVALSQIRAGSKRSHWMWFVFPQLAGLGSSPTSMRYAIKSAAEAEAYLQHPVLGARLMECCEALLRLENVSAEEVFGATDHLKLRSSATLFAAVAPPGSVFERVLQRFFGGVRDEETIRRMGTA